ncbi:hypothetical protein QVD17_27593 [Tagetes erecta]|uniref:SAM domain-containing protein n=1 Tax=Tagetes erecta TaxID=13708 RepID=A0AAD8KBB4_TARER|nr:hypothetical protein QVD17_27593 [Tagetes erecta]
MVAMDWYSWLSKTNLDPYLVYEYGRMFTHNELQRGDTNYFTHEFLQSLGVSVAKHRLEILKLTRKNTGNRFSKLVSTITKARMLLSKKFGRCVASKYSVHSHTPRAPDPNPFRPQWPSSNLRKNMGFEEGDDEKVKTWMKSGPLDRRVAGESLMSPKRVLSVSGPLERNMQANVMVMYGTPMDSTRPGENGSRIGINPYNMAQTTGDDEVDVVSSLWSLMFQNMKPT